MALRKEGGEIIIGKNTLAKLAIKILTEDIPKDHENYHLK